MKQNLGYLCPISILLIDSQLLGYFSKRSLEKITPGGCIPRDEGRDKMEV